MDFSSLASLVNRETNPQKREMQLLVLREKTLPFRLVACRDAGVTGDDLQDADTETFTKMMGILPKFDADKSQLHTFAYRYLYSAARITREKKDLIARPPSHYQDAAKLHRFLREWEIKKGKPVIIAGNEVFLAKKLGFTKARFSNARALMIKPVSMEMPVKGELRVEEVVGVDGDAPCAGEGNDRLYFMRAAMASLSKREKTILDSRYRGQMTLQEIGRAMGLTRERVRQIEAMAQKKLRRMVERLEFQKENSFAGSSLLKELLALGNSTPAEEPPLMVNSKSLHKALDLLLARKEIRITPEGRIVLCRHAIP